MAESKNTLQHAGVAYLTGDAALFAARMLEGDHMGALGGATWALGGAGAAKFGNPNAEKQLQLLSGTLGQYFRKQGIEIPATPDMALLSKPGFKESLESFFYQHPSEILNTAYAVGAAFLAKGGLKKNVKSDVASGALVMAGALSGLFIPEKGNKPDHSTSGKLERALDWVQEKPLRISGLLYGVNNVTTITGALEKRTTNKGNTGLASKSHWLRFITAASFIFANSLLFVSSKKHGGDLDQQQAMEKLADVSAKVIAAQPQQMQDGLIHQVSGFLSSQPEMKLKAEEISTLLNQKLTEVKPALDASHQWQNQVSENKNDHAPSL